MKIHATNPVPWVRPLALTLALLASGLPSNAQLQTAAIRAAAREEPIQLDQFEIKGDRARDGYYRAEASRSGTKTDTALLNLAQSISVVTREQIQDQQLANVRDLALYVPGVSTHQGENNRDQIIFRGNSSSADFFVNGVRDDVQYLRDFYNLDRVEVLRGPNAMIFGRGGGGGVINRATKEAEFSTLRELTLQAGSYGQARATLDLNQSISPEATMRFNAMSERSDSFRAGVDGQRHGINPTITLIPSKLTKVTLSYEHFRDTRTADRGITSFQGRPVNVPVDTFYGNPDDSHVSAVVNLAAVTIEHRTGNLTVRNRTLFGDYDRFYQNYVPGAVSPDQAYVSLTAYNNATRRRNFFNQTDLVYALTTGRVSHTLLGGFELGRQLTDNFRQTGFFNNSATSLSVPFGAPTIRTPATFRQNATDAHNHLQTDLAAVYAQDQIEFNRQIQAIVGLRFDSFDLGYRNRRNGDSLHRRDQLVSPRAGLIFKPLASLSLYASYGVSYLPSSGDQFSSLTTITQQVRPERFNNYELGAKWNLRRDLLLTAAVYRLDRTNTRATDPNDPTRILQTGSQRSNGFEVGLTGRVAPAWTMSAGYALQDAYISSATTAAPAGALVGQVPRHNFSWWNKYQLRPKLGLGLGLLYRSSIFASIDNTVTLPGYLRADAALYYSVNDRWRLQVNIENLFNRAYFVNADNNTNISPGAPRTVRASVGIHF